MVREVPPDAAPLELRVAPHGTALVVAWEDGRSSPITAAALRQGCRCAACTAARAAGNPVATDADIAVAAVEAIGGYAVNIAFSDGHARGIYPWSLLRALAAAPTAGGINPGPAPAADPAARS
jgi:prepilin-type processing-associated H-X9-DG protein